MFTRVEPCIKCTRSKLDTGQGVLGLVAPEDLLSACCLVLPLLLSALVSSCPFPSGLVPVGLQGLSWGSPGPLSDLSWAYFGPPGGPCLAPSLCCPGRPLGLLLASWASLRPLLGCPRGLLNPPLCLSGGSWEPKLTFHGTLHPPLLFQWFWVVWASEVSPRSLLGGPWSASGRSWLALGPS